MLSSASPILQRSVPYQSVTEYILNRKGKIFLLTDYLINSGWNDHLSFENLQHVMHYFWVITECRVCIIKVSC